MRPNLQRKNSTKSGNLVEFVPIGLSNLQLFVWTILQLLLIAILLVLDHSIPIIYRIALEFHHASIHSLPDIIFSDANIWSVYSHSSLLLSVSYCQLVDSSVSYWVKWA